MHRTDNAEVRATKAAHADVDNTALKVHLQLQVQCQFLAQFAIVLYGECRILLNSSSKIVAAKRS